MVVAQIHKWYVYFILTFSVKTHLNGTTFKHNENNVCESIIIRI